MQLKYVAVNTHSARRRDFKCVSTFILWWHVQVSKCFNI